MGESNVSPVEVQKKLGGLDYPASKQDLIDHAQKGGEDDNVTKVLKKILEKDYNSPVEVTKAVGDIE